MKSVAVFVALLAAASATTIFRTPSHDSAVISSQRVGGNFAYSVAESPAYGVVSPVVSHVAAPVATSYTVQQPAATTYTVHQPTAVVSGTPVTSQVATTYAVHQPTAVVSGAPVTSQVATTYAVHQPTTAVVSGTPVTSQVATTYGAWPSTYSSWPHSYWYGADASSSPIVYSAKTNVVGVETEKQINHVQPWTYSVPHVQSTAAWTSAPVAATTYTAVQGPSGDNVKTVGVSPVNWNLAYGYGQPWAWNTHTVV